MRTGVGHIALCLALVVVMGAPVCAKNPRGSTQKVAGLLRNDLCIYDGYLGVRERVFGRMSDAEERLGRRFVTVLNNVPKAFSVAGDMSLVINWDVLLSSEPCDLWSAEDLLDVITLAGLLQHSTVYGRPSDAVTQAVWYEYQLLSSSSYNDTHDVRVSTSTWRHPTTMNISTQVTYSVSVSTGGSAPLGILLVWLQLEGTWSHTRSEYGSYALLGPGNPNSHFYPLGEVGQWWYTDYHFHSTASYYQWYCTDEDVVGEITRIFQGTYTATGLKFDVGNRQYWPKLLPCGCSSCQP